MKKTSLYLLIVAGACMVACNGNKKLSSTNEVTLDTLMEKLLFPPGKFVHTFGDGAISIRLEKKKSLWLYGDSHVGEQTDDEREGLFPNVFGNVFVVLDGDSARTVTGGVPGNPGPVIASEPVDGKHAVYWPEHGFLKDGILHLFAAHIIFGGEGAWDFHCRAIVYCRLSYPDYNLIDLHELEAYPINKVSYGFGVHEFRGHYYFYGNHVQGYFASLHAGRARLVNNRLQDWEYFDGTDWTNDPSKTQPLEGIDVSVSSQFSIFKHQRKFILLNQERGIGTTDIYTFIADKPTGPWYNKKKIYSAPETKRDDNLFTYNAMAHPQYDRNDLLLVTYCVNTHKLTNRVSNYRPRYIRVPYQMIMK